MTRDELNAIAKLTDDELLPLTCVEVQSLEATVAQANAADARVEALRQAHDESLRMAATDLAATVEPLTTQIATLTASLETTTAKVAVFETEEARPSVKAAIKAARIAAAQKRKTDAIAARVAADAEITALG